MPPELFGFVAIAAPSGRRMLLNLDLTVALIEQEDGTATAISMAGVQTATGEKFESFVTDLLKAAPE